MSGEYIQAQYEQLAAVAQQFGQHAAQQAAMRQRVRNGAEALKAGAWQGKGSDAFYAEMADMILPALQRLETALREAQKVTQQIAQIMQTAEQDAAAPFRGGAAGGGAGAPVTDIPPRDYALMSQAAYSDSLPPELAAKGWQILETGATGTGYNGIAYVNPQTGEVVIAHRGTDRLRPGSGSDLDDDIQIARGQAPDQYRESQAFVQHVQQTMLERGYGDFQVTHTGHSLGGALADLHATGNGQRAITFDNPGTQEMLRGLGRPYNPDDLISYQSNPNIVNQANTQAGHSVRVGLNDEVNMLPKVGAGAAVGTLLGGPLGGVIGAGVGGIVGAAQKTLHDHSIDSIVDALDPGSGFPRRTVSD